MEKNGAFLKFVFAISAMTLVFVASIWYFKFYSVNNPTSNFGERKNENLLSKYLQEKDWQITFVGLGKRMEMTKIKNQKRYGHDIIAIEAGAGDKKLKLERVFMASGEFADDYFNDKKSFIESSYVKSLSAYPEVVTNTIECPSEFKPKKIEADKENVKILGYDFLTNDRFTYGVCSKDLVTHRGFSISVYCPQNNEMYNLEFSAPTSEANLDFGKILSEIKCEKD